MNWGFLMLKPFQLGMDKYISLLDSPAQAGEALRKFIKDLYQQNLLIQNKLEIGGAPGQPAEHHYAGIKYHRQG